MKKFYFFFKKSSDSFFSQDYFKKVAGFTLLEIILVVAIIAILTAVVIPISQTAFTQNSLDTVTRNIESDLSLAQTYARSGKNNSAWGVHIENNIVTIFAGSVYDPTNANGLNEVYAIPTLVTFSGTLYNGGIMNVVFAEGSGLPNISNSTGNLALTSKQGIRKTIEINSQGQINLKTAIETVLVTPVANISPGTYTSIEHVTLTTTAGATIYYTLDGSDPNSGKDQYSSAITISSTTTLKAIAIKTGMADSGIFSGTYIINLPEAVNTPTALPAAGTYASTEHVFLSTTTSGALIYYTTNGSDPTSGSTLYTAHDSIVGLTISNTTILKAIAIKAGMVDSGIFTGPYAITTVAITPPNILTDVAGKAAVNARQMLMAPTVRFGTYKLTFDGKTTGNINWNDNGTAINSALASVGLGDLNATNSLSSSLIIDFGGIYAGAPQPRIVVDKSLLYENPSDFHGKVSGLTSDIYINTAGYYDVTLNASGTLGSFTGQVAGMTTDVIITAVDGGTPGNVTLTPTPYLALTYSIQVWNGTHPLNQISLTSGDGTQIPTANIVLSGGSGNSVSTLISNWNSANPTEPIVLNSGDGSQVPTTNINLSHSTTVSIDTIIVGAPAVNAQQSINLVDIPDAGTYTLSFDGKTTGNINYNANDTAINGALSTAGLSELVATGDMLTKIIIEFTGAYSGVDQAKLSVGSSLLLRTL